MKKRLLARRENDSAKSRTVPEALLKWALLLLVLILGWPTVMRAESGQMRTLLRKPCPPPVCEIQGTVNPLLFNAFYHPDHHVVWADTGKLDMQLDTSSVSWNPEALTIASWVLPRQCNEGESYRMLAFKSMRGELPGHVDFKFGFKELVPEFGFKDRQGVWHGILRNAGHLRIPGQKPILLQHCRQLRPDHWNFVAAVFDRGRVSLYLDGKLVASGNTGVRELFFSDAPFRVGYGEGANGEKSSCLEGLIDRLSVYTVALTDDQIMQLYDRFAPSYPKEKVTLISSREMHRTEYDPKFQRKLELVRQYEKHLPASDLSVRSPAMSVMEHAGRPMLCRDGVLESGMCMMPYPGNDNRDLFNSSRDFAAAGVDYYTETLFTWMQWGHNCVNWWLGPGQYDFAKVEERLRVMIAANPKARLILRLKLNMPNWWRKRYPEEMAMTSSGWRAEQPSLTSKRWLKDICRMVGDLVRHLEQTDIAPHIVGYVPAGGLSSEWLWWGAPQGMIDYSSSNVTAFRDYLRKIYPDTAALRKAWNDPQVTFQNAMIPPPKVRAAGEDGYFRDALSARWEIDYRPFLSIATSRALLQVARTIHENSASRKLVGAFYGYSTQLAGTGALWNNGHNNLVEVLNSPDIDFFCSPTVYDRRRGGEEGDYQNRYIASLRLHGKLYWDEADMRTHLHAGTEHYRTATPKETSAVNWRTFGSSLIQGVNVWWFLIADNAGFHSERIMNEIAQMSKLDRELLDVSKESAAEIAVFCDEKSMLYVSSKGAGREKEYIPKTHTELRRVGAPFDFYMLSDISNAKLRNYKLYIFLNVWHVTPEMREAIHRKLAEKYSAAIWVYAPGYLSPSGNSVETMRELTGFTFRKFKTTEALPLHPVKATTVQAGGRFSLSGRKYEFNPGFAVSSPDAKIWAELGGEPVVAERETPSGRSFYSLIPLSAEWIREVCRAMKIHLYCDSGDVLQANRNFLMLHATSAGTKRIILPSRCDVRNLIDGSLIADVDTITVELASGDTVIYQLIQKEIQ